MRDPRVRAALTLVDSPYFPRDDADLIDDDREALDLVARIMSEFHALAAPAQGRGEPTFRWGPLDVYEEIGRGSFGVVYIARDRRLDLDVALKLQPLDADRDAHAIITEARRLARVRHINVCTVLGVDVHDGHVGLWTDHVAGRTLAERLEVAPLPVSDVIRVGVQLARALHAVNAAGLVHGDLTASNVIETPDGRIVLADFGSSIASAAGPAGAIPRSGTPLAMAPELFTGGDLTPAADIYALGALLFRLLSGQHIVPGTTFEEVELAHCTATRRSLDAYRDDVPRALSDAIARATAALAEVRFQDPSAMQDALLRSGVPGHNLAAPSTSFVGRYDDVVAVRAALEGSRRERRGGRSDPVATPLDGARLVTLTGLGGVGKTRLAVEVARAALHGYPDGVWFTALDDVRPDDIPAAIAGSIGLGRLPDRTADAVAHAIAERRLLLVLDTCEHMAVAVAEVVATLLSRAPHVTVLCASRTALGPPGEVVYAVSPLVIVDGASEPLGAVRLLLDRLGPQQAIDGSTEWSDTVTKICRHVDGIPLAIELAADLARSLDLPELERRLAKRLGVLTAGGGSRPERHRTMDGLVAWSVRSLDEACRSLLTTLGVFPGSFTLDAAEGIAGTVEPGLADPLPSFVRLVDASLVQRLDATGSRSTTRYRLLAPVRQFAAGALERRSDASVVRDAFHAFYAQRAIDGDAPTDGDPPIRTGERPAPLASALDATRLESDERRKIEDEMEAIHADYHNIRPALDAYLEDPEGRATAQAIVVALFHYWYDRGLRNEAWGALRGAIGENDASEVTPVLARLRYHSGILASTRGDLEAARRDFERSRSHARQLGLTLEEAKALSGLALVIGRRSALEGNQGGLDQAVSLIDESVRGYRQVGDRVREGEAYNNIGTVFLRAQDHERARDYFERARPLLCGRRSLRVLTAVLGNLARLDELVGNVAGEAAHLREAAEAARQSTDVRTAAYCFCRLGYALARVPKPGAAVPVLEEATRLARQVGDDYTMAAARLPLARCAAFLGHRTAALAHVRACLRFLTDPSVPHRGRDDLIGLAVREGGYVAAGCGSWTRAGWMLGWSTDYLERQGRAVGPHDRQRFADVSAQLTASIGADWRERGLAQPHADREDALARAREELAALAANS